MLHLFQVLLFSIVFLFFSCSGAKYREICRITPEYTNCSDGYCGGKDMLKLFPNNSKIINASNRFLLCESIRNVFYKNIQESLKKIQEQASHNSINVKESYKLNEIIEEQLDIKIAEWFSNNFLDLKKGVGLDEKNIGKQLGKIMQKRIINNFKAFNNENKNLNIKSLSLLNNIVKEWFFNNTNDFKKPDEKNTREQLNTIIQELLAGIFEIVGIKVPEQSHNTHDSTITKSNNLDLNGNGLSVEDIASSHLGSYCIISMGERFFYIPLLLTKQVSSCNMHKSKPVPTQRRRNDYINCNPKNNTPVPVSLQATGSNCNAHNPNPDKQKGPSYINCSPQNNTPASSQATGSVCNVHNSKPDKQKVSSYINWNPQVQSSKVTGSNCNNHYDEQLYATPQNNAPVSSQVASSTGSNSNTSNTSDDEQDYDFPQNNVPVLQKKALLDTKSGSNAFENLGNEEDYDILPPPKPVEQTRKNMKTKQVHFTDTKSNSDVSYNSDGEQDEEIKLFSPEDYKVWLAEESKKSKQKKMSKSNNYSGSHAEPKSDCNANNNNRSTMPLISLEEAQDKFGPKVINDSDNDTGICDCICCIS